MQTLGLPTGWSAPPANNSCWIMRQGDSC